MRATDTGLADTRPAMEVVADDPMLLPELAGHAGMKMAPPGSPDALLRRGPLRTGRARFPGIRLKQATRATKVLLRSQRWAPAWLP